MINSQPPLERLKAKLAEIGSLIPEGAPIVYLDYPVHGNFGDLLIFLGTRRFLAERGYSIESCMSRHWLPEKISPDAVVLMHGGGNFGDLYPHHQAYREAAITRFPNHRIVILPQTIHYQQAAGLRRAREVFKSHPDLHLIVRDSVSLEIARQNFEGCNPRLLPDMAHWLWPGPSIERRAEEKSDAPMLLMRNDEEKCPVFPELERRAHQFRDWSDFYTRWEGRQIELWKFMHRVDAKLHGHLALASLWISFCKKLYSCLSGEFSVHETWLTSRLHGGIFATLLGKNVGLLDNSYGKNKSYYETWAEYLEGAEFLDTPQRLRSFLAATPGKDKALSGTSGNH